jgi:heavy metal sensor kinase
MTLWYVALLAVIVTAVGAFVVVRLRSDLTATMDEGLRAQAGQIATAYGREGPTEFQDTSGTVLSGERAASQVLAADGRVLLSHGDDVANTPLIERDEIRAGVNGHRAVQTLLPNAGSKRFRVAYQPVVRKGRRQVVVAAESLGPVDSSVHRVVVLLLFACPVALFLTAAGGWWLARRSLRPIERITTTAAAIDAERPGERLAESGTRDEVGHLARTLNKMLDRIRGGVEQQRRLVADASHELRTPLASMRAELDVSLRADDLSPAAREVLASVRDDVDRMSRTVDDLLTLAEADDHRLALGRGQVDLQQLARQAGRAIQPIAAHRAVTVEVNGQPALVDGDPERLRQAVGNLLDNAVKFSPDGGRVAITTRNSGGVARLTVTDEGPGVPPEDRARIFERFFRGDSSRTRGTGGSGLGLAIVHEIVTAHGGRVWAEEAEPPGSTFSIELPGTSQRAPAV